MRKEKSYRRESIECYIFCFVLLFLFLGIIGLAGQLAGSDLIGSLKVYLNAYF